MRNLLHPALRAVLLTALLGTASCGRKPAPPPTARPQFNPNGVVVAFGKGFHEQEVIAPARAIRWARRDAEITVKVPADGCYRVTLLPFTAFASVEDAFEVSVDGEPAGEFTCQAYFVGNARPKSVEVTLRAGNNRLRLHSAQPEVRLGGIDERLAAFGLLMPVLLERVPSQPYRREPPRVAAND